MAEIKSQEELKNEGNEFHARLLADDLTVTAEIANKYLEPLVDVFSRRHPQLDDPHLIPTAVEDALLSYFNRPDQFDPQRGISLFSYLRMSADGDLKNLLQKHTTYIAKLNQDEFVELSVSESEYRVDADVSLDLELLVEQQNSPVWTRLVELFPNDVDRELVLLMMEGERATKVFAEVLNILDLPINEQKARVKRNKDRIKKTVQRHINPLDLQDD